jgi:hypothetical protein
MGKFTCDFSLDAQKNRSNNFANHAGNEAGFIVRPPWRLTPGTGWLMPSLGETIYEVMSWVIAGFQHLLLFICHLFILGVFGYLLGLGGIAVDEYFLGWGWPDRLWTEIGVYGLLGWYALVVLAPVVWETIVMLVQTACALAGFTGLFALLFGLSFVPLFLNVAVWFFPAVFVLWLARCAGLRRRGEDDA